VFFNKYRMQHRFILSAFNSRTYALLTGEVGLSRGLFMQK